MAFRFRSETRPMDARARAGAPGKFAALRDGTVYYELSGPDSGPVVVLVPGYSVPAYIWDPTFHGLAQAGLRVLRYDLFGRGWSDRPSVRYNLDLYDRQLFDLLASLHIQEPVDLVGLSMGGPIIAEFARRHPGQVGRLSFIDPVGLPWKRPLSARLLEVPLLGELMMDRDDQARVDGLKGDFHRPEKMPADYQERYREQLRYVGFKRALLSSLRNGMFTNARAAFAAVGRSHKPVQLIWAREDTFLPFNLNEQVRALIPQAEFHPIAEAGHVPQLELPELINALLIEFLRRPMDGL